MTNFGSGLRLSVLDQSPRPAGAAGGAALRNTLALAQACDCLGYHRYWLAEHHATPALAGAAPEVMIGPVAQATVRMRIGAGGVMLPHYSPLKVAECFSMLAALAPGRIDLGIGRAPGSDLQTALALQRDRRERAPDDFARQLAELLGYFNATLPEQHPFARYSATLPGHPEQPELWLLGSSADSAAWAAEAGLPYCFADFIASASAEITAYYRYAFQPSAQRRAPETAVAAWVICADTAGTAEQLASSARMMLVELLRGRSIAVPQVEEALAFLANDPGAAAAPRRRMIVGDPFMVRAEIEALAAEYGAGEVMLVTIVHDHAARVRSYELIADAFGLRQAG